MCSHALGVAPLTDYLRDFCVSLSGTYMHCSSICGSVGVRKLLISLALIFSWQATNQGVVGSIPASRTI